MMTSSKKGDLTGSERGVKQAALLQIIVRNFIWQKAEYR